ncbi:hypothetical protein V5T82_17775 [Magnetovibrio sp. PR-2]|uniref:hypothetical protein n=1 Tax=Magnetovibrio sp. PR-2 TaxID=3120356 RepID=UPI002FCE2C9B
MGILQNKKFQLGVALPSAVWLLICIGYVSNSVGWENLSALLAHELMVIILGTVLPVGMFYLFFATAQSSSATQELVIHTDQQGRVIQEISDALGNMVVNVERQSADSTRIMQTKLDEGLVRLEQSSETRNASVDAQVEGLSGSLSSVRDQLANQAQSIDGLQSQLEELTSQLGKGDNVLDLDTVHQRTAIMGFVNIIINDINVSITRILVRLMESENRPKPQIKDFVQGLANAFSVGDRGVFITVLQHQLSGNLERMTSLQTAAKELPIVQTDMAQIIRELNEMHALFSRVDDPLLIKTIYDIERLGTLQELLSQYFHNDGSPKDTVVY